MQSIIHKDLDAEAAEGLGSKTAPAAGREKNSIMQSSPQASRSVISAPGVYGFWRGRVALYAILKSLGVGPGDGVLVPGYTCFAVPAAVVFAGARPVYVDIEPETYNISLQTVQAAWSENARARVKAILIQHTFGVPAHLDPLLAWAHENGIATIEDCAHAWGSRYRNGHGQWNEVGTSADAAFFSSQWTKPISTGLGGWARANNARLDAALHEFLEQCVAPSSLEVTLLAGQVVARGLFSSSTAHWVARSIYQRLYRRGLVIGTSTPDELQGNMPVAYPKQMSAFQRWLLERRLAETSVQTHRRRLKSLYDGALESAGLPVFAVPDYADAVLLRYPVRVPNKKQVLAEAERRWIELGDWYAHPIDPPQGLRAEVFDYRAGMCPEGERAAAEVVNLPMHSGVKEKTVTKVVSFLKEVA